MRACVVGLTVSAGSTLSLAQAPTPVPAERRVALVIGNSNYASMPRLSNARNDAVAIARQLIDSGFEVVGGAAQLDLDKPRMERVIQDFGRALRGGAVGMFYYAGHGVQVRNRNFLLPISANVQAENEISLQAIEVSQLLDQFEVAGTRLSMIVLDACRSNPFPGSQFRSSQNGLATMQAAAGTLISFSAQPGALAQDGPPDGNSPFAEALLARMRAPGLNVLDVFNGVGVDVARRTGQIQQPWVSNSPIEGQFFFTPAAAPVPAAPPTSAPQAQIDSMAIELAFWQALQGSTNPAEYETYLRQFPNGRFAELARARIATLRQAQATPRPEPTPPAAAQPPAAANPIEQAQQALQALQQLRQQGQQPATPPTPRPPAQVVPPAPPQVAVVPPVTRAVPPAGGPQSPVAPVIAACPVNLFGQSMPLMCTCDAASVEFGQVFGSDVYADLSSPCRAALHAGAITAQGGTIVLRSTPLPLKFDANTRNGVEALTTRNAPGAFRIARATVAEVQAGAPAQQAALPPTPAPVPAQPPAPAQPRAALPVCPATAQVPATTPQNLRVVCQCTAELIRPGNVIGTNFYIRRSSICGAARHAGVIGPQGGPVAVTLGGPRTQFEGTTRNGVSSWGSAETGPTFTVAAPTPADLANAR